MTNQIFSNVYGVPEFPQDEPYSFESINYTNPTPFVTLVTVFRGPMQAPPLDWYWPDGTWIQETPLPLRQARVYFRQAMQAPDPWYETWNYMPAWNPNNVLPLHSATAHSKYRILSSPPTGDAEGTVGSKITGKPN